MRGLAIVALAAITLVLVPQVVSAETSFEDISPDFSPRYAAEYGLGGWGAFAAGGRVNSLAGVPGTNQLFYAATEWGGLWKTLDGGDSWFPLTGHVPMAVWDVAVDPIQPATVYATSFYDGRVNPVSGIQVSHTSGFTWTHPSTATPAGLDCRTGTGGAQAVPGEWSAFGIGIRPDAPEHVFIGTSCGVAISDDSGNTWRFVDPDPDQPGLSYVWDVVVQPGGPQGKGIVDVCGVEGHSRSIDGGQTWEHHDLPYPNYTTGRCSIAASPDEPYVLFVVDDIVDPLPPAQDPFPPDLHMLYESDDGGRTWFQLGNPFLVLQGNPPTPRATKRLTFVVTNKRSASGGTKRFDVWYGEVDIWRAECETPNPATPAGGGTTFATIRCPPAQFANGTLRWSGPPQWLDPMMPKQAGDPTVLEQLGAHGDSGDLEFDLTVSEDACPLLYASDGGVFLNRPAMGADCQSPKTFQQPSHAAHALWLWGMAGSNLPGDVVAVQFGVQDDGSWAAPDAHAMPTWQDGPTSDSFSRVADENRYLWNDQQQLHTAAPGSVAGTPVTLPQAMKSDGSMVDRLIPQFGFTPKIDQLKDGNGNRQYVVVTDFIDLDGNASTGDPDEEQKVFVTQNFGSNPLTWIELGVAPPPGPDVRRTGVGGSRVRSAGLLRSDGRPL